MLDRRATAVALMLGFMTLAGCESAGIYARSQTDAMLFGPSAMRIHPIFTQVKDWTGDDRPDGIEALIELQDQFGDPTKASGRVIFELYEYRAYQPDPRGDRLANPWVGELGTLESQQQRWNRTSRTYGFQLAFPEIREDRPYVLTATFELSGGGRFFDQIILEPREQPTLSAPSTAPSTEPTTRSGL